MSDYFLGIWAASKAADWLREADERRRASLIRRHTGAAPRPHLPLPGPPRLHGIPRLGLHRPYSARFDGRRVGRSHAVEDGDVVEILP